MYYKKKLVKLLGIFLVAIALFSPLVLADTIPPKMLNIQFTVTANSSTITWQTDEPGTTAVFYGKTIDVQLTRFFPEFILGHTVNLEFLDFSTTYFFKVSSCDNSNNCNTSQLMNFTTLSVPAPVKITDLVNVTTTRKQIVLNWTKSEDPYFKGYRIYRNDVNIANETDNKFTDKNVAPSALFNYQVSAFNIRNDEGERSDVLTVITPDPDISAPVLTQPKVTLLTPTSARINWETDENANATVKYGNASLPFAENRKTFLTNHTIELKNLQTGTLVKFATISCDDSGNCVQKTGEFVPGSDIIPPFINVSLPRYFNQQLIRVAGLTEPLSEVRFFVNNAFKGFVSRERTGKSGKIDFSLGGFAIGNNNVEVVAEDGAGNIARRNFTVTIDNTPPNYVISNIPPISKEENLVINGSVNEQVTVEFFVSLVSALDFDKPERVKNLKVGKIEKNRIELRWDKVNDSDVSKYVIYRDGLRLTFTNTNEFIDSAVDTDTSYQYEVTALDNSCNEGERAEVVEAKTLANGSILKIAPKQIELPCKEKSLIAKLNTSNKFKQQIRFLTGLNEIEVMFTDLAGNTVSARNRTIFNNKPPKILTTNLNELNPSYVSEVTIKGKVSEQARVLIFVNNNGTKPDVTVNTAPDGSFKADIQLERNFGFSSSVKKDVGQPIAPVKTTGQASIEQFSRNDIRIVAINNVGLSDEVKGFINYAVCGGGGDWDIEIKNVYPNEIIPRFLIEGFAQIGFGMNFTYRGLPVQGKEPAITNIKVRAGFPSGLSTKDRAGFDEDWVSTITEHRTGGQKSAYALINFKKVDPVPKGTMFQKEENLTKHGKGRCFNIPFTDVAYLGAGCVNVPITIEITYQCEEFEQTGNQFRKVLKSCVQKHCTNVNVVITPRIPPRIIPKTLLKEAIELLTTTINAIDYIIKPLQTATQFTLIGCFGTWGAYFVKKSSEYFSCLGIDIRKCQGCSTGSCKNVKGEADAQCDQCYQAKLSTSKVWTALNYVCDRIMCPAVPSYEKYKTDQDKSNLNLRLRERSPKDIIYTSASNCGVRISSGTVTNANLANAKEAYIYYNANKDKEIDCNKKILTPSGAIDASGECCPFEYKKQWDPATLLLDPLKESACRAAIEKTKLPYAGLEEEKAKEEICGNVFENVARFVRDINLCGPSKSETTKEINVGGDWFVIEKFDGYGGNILYTGQEIVIQESDREGKPVSKTGRIVPVEPIYVPDECCTKGYGDPKCNPQYSGMQKTNQYAMGLCISEQENKDKANNICDDEKCLQICADKKGEDKVNCENTKIPECKGKARECVNTCNERAKRYQVTQKVPRAVIDIFCAGNQGKDYVIDPTADIVSSVQAGCMTGTLAYLNKYRTILNALRGCFQTILATGDGSAGLCRELISIYVCDLIYYAISCIKEYVSVGSGTNIAGEGLGGFLKFVSNAGSEVQQGIQGRYGTTSIYRALFIERSLIHSACIFAFTGDWDITFNNIIQQVTTIPIEPTIAIAPASRRFLSYDTTTGLATHVYHLGAFIVPGSDNFRYRVELVCSNTHDCDPNYFENGICDCARIRVPGERVFPVSLGNGLLRFGQTLNDAKFIPISSSPPTEQAGYRYDKVRVTYSYKDNKGEAANKVKEFKISHVGLQPPVSCKFDIGSLSYRCAFDIGEFGSACMVGKPQIVVDNKEVVGEDTIITKGKPVTLQIETHKTSPDRSRPVQGFAAKLELRSDLGISVAIPLFRLREDRDTLPITLQNYISDLLRQSPAIINCVPVDPEALMVGTPTGCSNLEETRIKYDSNKLRFEQATSFVQGEDISANAKECSSISTNKFSCGGIIITIDTSKHGKVAIIRAVRTDNIPTADPQQRRIDYTLSIMQPDEKNPNQISNNVASCGGLLQQETGTLIISEAAEPVTSDVANLPLCAGQPPYKQTCRCGNTKCGKADEICCSGNCIKGSSCKVEDSLQVALIPLEQAIVTKGVNNPFKLKAIINREDFVSRVSYDIVTTNANDEMNNKNNPKIWESSELNSKDFDAGSYNVVVTIESKTGSKIQKSLGLLGVSDNPCDNNNGHCVSNSCSSYEGYVSAGTTDCTSNMNCCKKRELVSAP